MARTRDIMTGPASALSAKVIFPKAASNGTDVVVNVDRVVDPAAYTLTYPVGVPLSHDTKDFSVTFYSSAAQTGSVVASGTATITWSGPDANLGSIALGKKVSSVSVVDPGSLYANTPIRQLDFVAKDATGTPLALTPGSATWSVTSGSGTLSITADGKATAVSPGTATVVASVDGIVSSAQSVGVTLEPIIFVDLTGATSMAHVFCIGGGMQGGQVVINGTLRPAVWSGSASSVNIFDNGGAVQGIHGLTQVGQSISPFTHAVIWQGSASMVDINPTFAVNSNCLATDGESEVGEFQPIGGGPAPQAVVWNSTAQSAVSLHPSGAIWSSATCVDGSTQGGYFDSSACIWHGTAASIIDLTPTGTEQSAVWGMHNGKQVGMAYYIGQGSHAVLWSGTAASAVDLNPPLAQMSSAQAIVGNYIVGHIDLKPAIWNATTHASMTFDEPSTGYVPNRRGLVAAEVTQSGLDVVGTIYPTNSPNEMHAGLWHIPASRLP